MELITTDSILSMALYEVRFAGHVHWWGQDNSRGVFLDRISAEKLKIDFSFF